MVTRAEIRAKSILATRAKYSFDVLKEDSAMRVGIRSYSQPVKDALIEEQDKMIMNFFNSHHGEYSRTEVANALGVKRDFMKNKLNKLAAQGKVERIQLDRPREDRSTVVFRGL